MVRVGAQVADRAVPLRLPGGRRRICRSVRTAIRGALAEQGITEAELSVTLLDDAGISALHGEHLGHEGPTDVLSFALYEPGEPVVGDIYIGVEQARRQAASLGVPFGEEVVRLAVHGTLHVLGMDHPDGRGRAASTMWKLQEEIVDRWRARR